MHSADVITMIQTHFFPTLKEPHTSISTLVSIDWTLGIPRCRSRPQPCRNFLVGEFVYGCRSAEHCSTFLQINVICLTHLHANSKRRWTDSGIVSSDTNFGDHRRPTVSTDRKTSIGNPTVQGSEHSSPYSPSSCSPGAVLFLFFASRDLVMIQRGA